MFTACTHFEWAGIASNCSMLMAYNSLNSLNPPKCLFVPQLQSGFCSKNRLPDFCPGVSPQRHDKNSCYSIPWLVSCFRPSFSGPFLPVFLEKLCIGIPESILFFLLLLCLILNWLTQISNWKVFSPVILSESFLWLQVSIEESDDIFVIYLIL